MGEMRAALRLARTLAGDHEADEPAALLYALAVCRRAFPVHWRDLALALARIHAVRLGHLLHLGPEEVAPLFFGITEGLAGYEDISMWVAEHLRPSQ